MHVLLSQPLQIPMCIVRAMNESQDKLISCLNGNLVSSLETFLIVDIDLYFTIGVKPKNVVAEIKEIVILKCALTRSVANSSSTSEHKRKGKLITELILLESVRYEQRKNKNLGTDMYKAFQKITSGNYKPDCLYYANNHIDRKFLEVVDDHFKQLKKSDHQFRDA
jgi:hypothetical protein